MPENKCISRREQVSLLLTHLFSGAVLFLSRKKTNLWGRLALLTIKNCLSTLFTLGEL